MTTDARPAAIGDARAREIDAFVRRHFRLRGSLRLHRHALGWDLVRAPVNVALAPVFLLSRLAALLLSLVGLRRAGNWLGTRRILFPSAVARRVGELVRTELLGGRALSARERRLIEDFTGLRSAVSEICTTLLVILLGFAIFHRAVPGLISLTPMISDRLAQSRAVADFPLGQRLGSAWYGVFPVEIPVWSVIALGVGLAMLASVVTTFAGVLADPLQARIGIHRRRLTRLIATIDAEGEGGGLGGEHLLARVADLTDIVASIVRFLRP